jgi:hypothetical protein
MTTTELPKIDDMKVADLRIVHASELGVDAPKRATRMELIAAISEHRAAQAQEPPEPVEGEVVNDEPDNPPDDGRSAPDASGDHVDDLVAEERKHMEMVLRERGEMGRPTALPSPKEWEAVLALATTLHTTEFVPRAYRGKPEAVAAAILAGRELGIGPMQSLRDIHMIDGRPAFAANLLMAQLRRGGLTIIESQSTNEHARIVARRRDTGETAEVEWTMEEADRAGLTSKTNWRTFPADMLWARCVGRLARRLGSDLVAGMPYTAEEVADFEDDYAGETYRPIERDTVREATRIDPDPVPKSWAEINEWAAAYGETFGWATWLRQATIVLFSVEKAEDSKLLTKSEREVLGQKAATVIYNLRKKVDPARMPPVDRGEVQEEWAKVLAGQVLPGPDWRMTPDEEHLPTYHEANGLPEPDMPDVEPTEDSSDEPDPFEAAADALHFGDEGAHA